MGNDGTNWHSDDELASALERALDIPTDALDDAGSAYVQQDAPAEATSQDFGDLFAALVESDAPVAAPAPVSAPASAPAPAEEPVVAEQVFESLDAFKPRTNFIPVVGTDSGTEAEVTAEAEVQAPAVSDARDAPASPVTLSSSQVTQPVRYDRQRPTFDEIVFGVTSAPENN